MKKRIFPHYTQLDAMDCGPTCLRMIARYYGKAFSLETLRSKSYISRDGVSMLGISQAAESIGFRTSGVRITLKQLREEMPLPCILHWNQNHFVVCYAIKKRNSKYRYSISDPGGGKAVFSEEEFKKCWISTNQGQQEQGTALALEPTPAFYAQEGEKIKTKNFRYYLKYLIPYKSQIVQLIIGMVVISMLQLIFPFLTQSLVDVGIGNSNLNFITLILVAQLILFLSQLSVEYIRSWIMLHMNTRINISLISDFLMKLMKLPLHFFDTKMIGDIMQRIGDHGRIEAFLTGSSISTLFSFFNFFIFSFILGYYNMFILGIFLIGNVLYILWILLFMRYRRELDMRRFALASGEQSTLIQLVSGMQEIKLNNCETQKRWKWEQIQVKLFNVSIKGLALGQIQSIGSAFFNQTTNIIISFIAAKSVVEGDMTLGMMMSLTYIIGQLNGPINLFISFIQQLQDAKISLERLNEIHDKEDEEQTIENKLSSLPKYEGIALEDVSFSYDQSELNYVLKNVSLTIPKNKVTAIVGSSGSGKTTLVKLMLGFYSPTKGDIKVGNTPLSLINPHLWRDKIGAVMQDGFIFSDTIAHNIAVDEQNLDFERIEAAAQRANIVDFIHSLPLGYHTKIGMEGNGISQGQRQRLLIARAIYKNPDFIFFDEATNSLDANNEKEIMEHLHEFYHGRTVVVVAHRLSTVRDADNIVVVDKGEIVEQGTHDELTKAKGRYYRLVKNQLELGQ